jgi:PD-(D/E)XK endonuclease
MLTTNQRGLVAETAILHECVKQGIGVSRPLDDERYDLILDLRPQLMRVQCKWARQHSDVVVIRTGRCRRGREGLIHRSYEDDEIDAIAAYCAGTRQCYLLPHAMSVGRAAVQLRLRPCRNNQLVGIHWARDFELGATLSALRGPIAQLGERKSGRLEAAGSSPAGSISRPYLTR